MLRTLVLALFALGAPLSAAANVLDERIAVEPGGRLEIDLDLGTGMRPDPGSIEVSSHDIDEVRMLATPSGWGDSAVVFRVERDGSAIRLYGSVEGAFSWMFGGPSTALRVWVPRSFSVDVRASAGPIRIENIEGEVRARTQDALIEVISTRGPVRVRSINGDVRISEVVGDVRIRATKGDLEIGWVTGAIEARTGDGEIDASHIDGRLSLRTEQGRIGLSDVAGPVEAMTESGSIDASFLRKASRSLQTYNGNISVALPADVGAELFAESRSGEVSIAADLGFRGEATGDRAVGPVNGGGQALRLFSADGRVELRTR